MMMMMMIIIIIIIIIYSRQENTRPIFLFTSMTFVKKVTFVM